VVDHPNIKQATSVVDFIFRVLGMEYLGRTDFVHKPVDAGEPHPLTPAGAQEPAPVKALPPKETGTSEGPFQPKAEAKDSSELGNGKYILPEVTESVSSSVLKFSENPQESVLMSVLDEQLSQMMGDAPFCNICGHITVRSGSCYKCLNCGNSMGCS
jgi:ribonucleoside-diphosphate reductase alpha chain